MAMRIEWDPEEADANRRKHGVDFELALRVFADPSALTDQVEINGNEFRWRTLGLVEGRLLLLVVHTVREQDECGEIVEVIRIISARVADRRARRRYEQENR
jgi:uncharacterized DUF497 family protein